MADESGYDAGSDAGSDASLPSSEISFVEVKSVDPICIYDYFWLWFIFL